MAHKESHELALKRWTQLELLQGHYTEFSDFLYDGITELMGFKCTVIQLDIAKYMEYGPQYSQVQAQRGQAKTTIAAFYAVYLIIHDPTFRILIFSAASSMSTEISNWIIQIIMGWDILTCIRPDRQAGDRASTEKFDIHHSLKGPEKSPSVACLGIESNMQGRRADLVIADDIESSKNSRTAIQREKLLTYANDFPSICQRGGILYLGTPQSGESIYNSLPGKGFDVRIWPGRFPTDEELPSYGTHLAPLLRTMLTADPTLQIGGGLAMNRGKPTDPELLNEEILAKIELGEGPSYFQLQHMLCTELSDSERYPLKIRDLMVYPLDNEEAPAKFRFSPTPENAITKVIGTAVTEPFYRAAAASQEYFAYTHRIMYVDPAGGGQNGDETAYVVVSAMHGYMFVMDIGAVPGGYGEDSLATLSDAYVKWSCKGAYVEKNYGHGALAAMWTQYQCGRITEQLSKIQSRVLPPETPPIPMIPIEDFSVTGQKEKRICDTLEPLIRNHKLIINESVLQRDADLCKVYATERRSVYQLFFQLAKITRDKDSLIHDDRLDALAGAVSQLMDLVSIHADNKLATVAADRYAEMMRDPLGTGVNPYSQNSPGTRLGRSNMFKRRK